ncbi:solute carrier family 22 member 4-like isoform X1 [Echeneis naucrates]|uniref:Solute carrier family 22 member 4-like n=1 Tax=Echeneis naucrates TaxID=173247 RepID=A0A665VF38_ECHNA|nr:solute carrier family 22 member 4-like isoform X1 [Echeneis naucrates]XP_029375272.1 solute carrier family 22 member 4-like isoform X1 [Echeneis naucrates]XP_029375274.1 solute carrier family 22 member 4-like isoform X1 [Echeneis naucrates]
MDFERGKPKHDWRFCFVFFFFPHKLFTLLREKQESVAPRKTLDTKVSFEKDANTENMKNYDDSIAFLGECGFYQKAVFFLLCASTIPNGFGVFALVFLMAVPSHHCQILNDNLTEDWHKTAIPIMVVNGKQELSRCSRYRLDVLRNLSAQGYAPGRDINLTGLEQEGCVDGWNYSRDIYQSTIVSEFDLVCSEHWKQTFTSTVFFLGVLVGSFFSGQLSDRFGRKPILFGTTAIQTVFTLALVFCDSWAVFSILFFISALGQISNFVAALVLGAEIFTGNVRVLYSSLGTCLGFTVGYMMLPLFAYFLRDWKSLLLALSVPGLAYLPLWWLIPESPQWLLSQERVEEAEAIVRKAAKWNKVQAPSVIFQYYRIDRTETRKEKYNIFDLLRKSDILVRTLILCLVMFTMNTGYYGLAISTSQFHVDPYISCFISAAVEIPAYISSWLALRYLPRRLSVTGILLLGAVPLYFIQLLPQNSSNISLALKMLGKYAFTTGSSMILVYMAELYPTKLRNTATGVSNTVARVGSSLTPFLLKLGLYNEHIPHITFGTLAVISAFAALFLPETFGQPLPETIEQIPKRERMNCPCTSREEYPVTTGDHDSPL